MLKIKTIKLFLLLSVFLFSIAILVGCFNPTESDKVKATYVETSYKENVDEGKVNIVNNHLDLVTLLENDTPEKYNDSFFENNNLLVFKIIESSKGNKSEIETYEICDKVLNIYVKTKQYGDDCMMACWWHILELSKDETDNFDIVKIFRDGDETINTKISEVDKKEILFESLKFKGYFNHSVNDVIKISNIFFSKEEIINEFSKYEIIWTDVPFWDSFNDEYFKKKAIVVYFYWFSGSNIKRYVNSLTIEDNKLEINLVQKIDTSIVQDDEIFFKIVLEVNKEEVDSIDEIILKIN